MNWTTIQGFTRHLLTFAGGFLVTNGTINSADLETAVGALVALLGLAWSIWDKRKPA